MEQHSPVAQALASSVPDWLNPSSSPETLTPPLDLSQRRTLTRALQDTMFEAMFERVLDEMVKGRTFSSIIRDDVRSVDLQAFWRWIKKDPQRHERYKEAKELRAEWGWAGRIIEIAEADDSIEDVARSKLKIDTYKWLMGADNRKTYGETKQVEINQSISITAALEAAQSRIAPTQLVDDVIDMPHIEHTEGDE